MIQRIELPNGKQLLFIDTRSFQRFPGYNWEPFDQRVLIHTPVPKDAKVEVWKDGSGQISLDGSGQISL